MKRVVVVLGAVLVIGVVAIILLAGVWRSALSAPRYYDTDGKTLWKSQMALVEQKSFWPYKTKYNVAWNGVSLRGNGIVVQKRWVQFALWNGHGVDNVKVYELNGDSERLVYPTENDVRQLTYSSPSKPTLEMSVSLDNTIKNGKYIIFGIEPPSERTGRLRIVVTDKQGNVTEDILPVSSIRH